MAAFASPEQYRARFGEVSDAGKLRECLEDASAAIRIAAKKAGLDIDAPDDDLADRLMRTCRSVANRIMPAEGSPAMLGVTQMGVTAGTYSEQVTYQPSYGMPKLLPSELDMLGIGSGRAGWLPLAGDDE